MNTLWTTIDAARGHRRRLRSAAKNAQTMDRWAPDTATRWASPAILNER